MKILDWFKKPAKSPAQEERSASIAQEPERVKAPPRNRHERNRQRTEQRI